MDPHVISFGTHLLMYMLGMGAGYLMARRVR
jgi:hypothetical protein